MDKKPRGFIQLFRELISDPAYQDLSFTARLHYQNILYFDHRGIGKKIVLPYSKLPNKMAPSTKAKADRELEEHGFVYINRGCGVYRHSNEYDIINNWKKWGTDKFILPKINRYKPTKSFKELWEKDKDKMEEAHRKAAETRKADK